jgi:transposase-like protein
LLTTAGELDLRIPKLQAGSCFPSLPERRRRVDQTLFAVVMEAYVHYALTARGHELVSALTPWSATASAGSDRRGSTTESALLKLRGYPRL